LGSLAVFRARSGPADETTAAAMLAAAPHRGTSREVQVAGDAVLGVSYEDALGDASIASHDGWTAAFAGSLDNVAELDAELGRRGAGGAGAEHGAGGSAAGTVLSAFRAWGEQALARLRGSFSGAVAGGGELRVFRDQFGTKPLFARQDDRGYYAATEIKQVVAGAGISRTPDLGGLEDIFYGTVKQRTAVAGVGRVGRASVVLVSAGGRATERRYWDPRALLETSRADADEAAERVAALLERATARCLTPHSVVLLSGGLDSPTIAAFAAERARTCWGRPLEALTATFPDHPSVDESELVGLVASELGLSLSTYVARAGVLDDVERWVDVADGPTDTLSLPQVAEAFVEARRGGARTVLTGEMAEYVFELRTYMLDHLIANGRLGAAGRAIAMDRRFGRGWSSIARELVRVALPSPVGAALKRRFGEDGLHIPAWVDAARVGGTSAAPPPARRRWSENQLGPFLGSAYSFEADDIAAATCGVQVRWPFADIDLWEYVLSLRAETKYPDARTKSLVRRAMHDRLPPEIVDRRTKTAFNEYSEAKPEYPDLRRLVGGGDHRLPGVDYALLSERLERENMDHFELQWARDLARVHAFLRLLS
jgi:asparagine synthase (glutamine-hydrolysing)